MNENKNVIKKRTINDRLKITVIGCGACGNGIVAEIQEDVLALEGNKSNVSFVGINTSMGKADLNVMFEIIKNRNPVLSSGFHTDMETIILDKPVVKLLDIRIDG